MRRRTLLGLLGGGAAAGGGGAAALGGLPGGSGPQNESEGRGPTADCSELEQRVGELEAQVSALREERDGLQVAHDERIGSMLSQLYQDAYGYVEDARSFESEMHSLLDDGRARQAAPKAQKSVRHWLWAGQTVVNAETIAAAGEHNLKAGLLDLEAAMSVLIGANIACFTAAELLEIYASFAWRGKDRSQMDRYDEAAQGSHFSVAREDRENASGMPPVEEFEAALWVDG